MNPKKVCIYGAGAIGGWLGVALAKAGCELSAVARGQTLAALQHNGLTLMHGEERETVTINAQQDPEALGVQDVVVIAVKAPAMPDVARQIGSLIGPQTLVLTAMNGVPWWFLAGGVDASLRGLQLKTVDPQGDIARAISTEQVIGSVVHASCSLDAPGVVRRHFGNSIIVGEPMALPGDAATERLLALGELLRAGGLEVKVSGNIQRDAWYKLWGNMTMNPVSAITGATTDKILGDELVRNFITAVMFEAKEIGARIGLPIADSPQDRHQVTLKLGSFKTSMLQDVEAGKPLELDALVGAVREMGAMCGIATPFTDALLGLTRLRAQQLGLYPL